MNRHKMVCRSSVGIIRSNAVAQPAKVCYFERMKRDTEIEPVPRRFAGKWIAWNKDRNRIVGSGRTLREAWSAALKAGEKDPVLDKVPQTNAWFVGVGL